jgi:hypothetical protein
MVTVRAMFSPKADGPLTVQVPGPAEDRPSWTKVGVIAAIGFIVGIAWPKIAGVRLGPSVPESGSSASSAAASAAAADAPATTSAPPSFPALGASPAPPPPAAAPPAAPTPAGEPAPAGRSSVAASAGAPPSVAVAHGFIFGCKTPDGDALKGSECGTLPGLDGVVMPRLRRLADCPDAAGASGKLHLIVHVDFGRGSLSADLGRNQSLASAEALLACARSDVAGGGANLGGVQHDNPRYSVAYSVVFGSGGGAGSASGNDSPVAAAITTPARPIGDAAESSAQIVYDVALVRDAPRGKVVARLPRGSTIRLGAAKDGWYPVHYGDGFSSDGWVYRGAVGR